MAVSQAVKGSIRRWCEITEIPWSEQKIIERVRAFRADARDRADEGIADPEALAELLCGSFSTLLLTKYAETNMEALVAGLFDCALTTAAKQKLTGDAEINWEAVATAVQENEELEGSEYEEPQEELAQYQHYYVADSTKPELWGMPVPVDRVKAAILSGSYRGSKDFITVQMTIDDGLFGTSGKVMAARFPEGAPRVGAEGKTFIGTPPGKPASAEGTVGGRSLSSAALPSGKPRVAEGAPGDVGKGRGATNPARLPGGAHGGAPDPSEWKRMQLQLQKLVEQEAEDDKKKKKKKKQKKSKDSGSSSRSSSQSSDDSERKKKKKKKKKGSGKKTRKRRGSSSSASSRDSSSSTSSHASTRSERRRTRDLKMQAKIIRLKSRDPRKAAQRAVRTLEKNPKPFYFWSATKSTPAAATLAESFINHGGCLKDADVFLNERNLKGSAMAEGMIVAAAILDQAIMADGLGFDAACVEIAARRFLAAKNTLEHVRGPITEKKTLDYNLFASIDVITEQNFHGGMALKKESTALMTSQRAAGAPKA